MTARPRQVKGITPEILKKMISVQPDNVTGARNVALLQVGYEILARRSELTTLRVGAAQELPQEGTQHVNHDAGGRLEEC